MKSISKLLRIVALATILALLIVAIPATPVLAAESIDLDPDEGEIGDKIDVTGDNFTKMITVDTTTVNKDVDIYFSKENGDIDDIDDLDNYEKWSDGVSSSDKFSKTITIPSVLRDGDDDEDVHSGTYYFYVTYDGDDDIEDYAKFTVIAAEITLDIDEGPVGTEVEITGVDFVDREEITVEYDATDVDIESGDTKTDSAGAFDCTIIIPESTAGKHTITVKDETGSEALADFTVEEEITVTPATGAAGDTLTVKGTGFGNKVDVTIEFDGGEVTSAETDSDGSFQVGFTLPVKNPGTYSIEAKDEENNKDTADFTVAAGVTLGQTTGNVGSQVTINGSGFTPNATVTITYATEPIVVVTTTADADGKFSATFTVPESKYGQHTLTATDGTNTVTTTFTMESSPPQAPLPLEPFEGDKAKSRAYFDWGDVTDPSGVTYTLQIATDGEFTSPSMVLEKTGRTESEYTLTKEERLKSTKQEAPYYWRVRAVDGAENESGWTTPGTFYVGFAFELAGWILYTLMAIAGLLLLAVGYLLGRRTAYT